MKSNWVGTEFVITERDARLSGHPRAQTQNAVVLHFAARLSVLADGTCRFVLSVHWCMSLGTVRELLHGLQAACIASDISRHQKLAVAGGSQREVATVTYQYNVLGTSGPRRMTAALPLPAAHADAENGAARLNGALQRRGSGLLERRANPRNPKQSTALSACSFVCRPEA